MKKLTVLLLLQATPQWLSLSRTRRRDFFSETILPIFERVRSCVAVRLFDSEYAHAKISDFMIVETTDYAAYQLFIELLRDSKVYSEPYFDVRDIIIGEENAFMAFDQILAGEAA